MLSYRKKNSKGTKCKLNKIAKLISNYYFNKGRITIDEKEEYEYSLEIMIASIVNFMVLLTLTLLTKCYIESIVFITVFAILRMSVGGYHAKTHFGCVLSISVIYMIMIFFLKYLNLEVLMYLSIAFVGVSIPIIGIYAPVDSVNKRLDMIEQKKHRKASMIKLIAIVGFYIMLLSLNQNAVAFTVGYTLINLSISLVLGRFVDMKYSKPKIMD